jgi:GTPase SAR1 family protein
MEDEAEQKEITLAFLGDAAVGKTTMITKTVQKKLQGKMFNFS